MRSHGEKVLHTAKFPFEPPRRRSLPGNAVSLAAGLMMPLAFAPFGWHGLAVVSLALLFHVLMDSTPWRAFRRGWLFGIGMFGVGVFWIHESFRFAAVALPLALALTGALVMVLALYPALFGALASYFSRYSPRATGFGLPLLVLPAGWVLLEWLRGGLFSGFPWLQVGYAHVDSPLAGLAPLAGVYGVGWASAFSSGLVLWAVRRFWDGRQRSVKRRLMRWAAPLLIGAGVWGGAALLGQVAWTAPVGEPLRAALIQGNIPQDIKWRPEQREKTVDRYLFLTRQARGQDLVVWPETALPGVYHEFPQVMARLRREARVHGGHVLLGVPTVHGAGRARRYFNSVVAITGSGPAGEEAFYHKRHLVPFGEYLPLAGILRGIVDFLRIPMSDFYPGPPAQGTLSVAGQEIGASVCYEAAFGRDIIASLPEATLLVNVSNDAWFGDSLGPHQNLRMARLRAREAGRYLLRGTNTGISAFIDPQGRVIRQSPQFEVSVLTGIVTGMTGATPYVRYGDWIVWPLLGIVLLVWYRGRRNGRIRVLEESGTR
uniref:Apolipoprotein N-acyltransferase n=1 Tax=Candidatus Kentrum sp. DK TaxID=2126562 RepID=A0A450RUT0_9GAMM|nr:MAG: apolipoprotein N-acyltransferase [Candidatus Kentron sp. DK]